MLNWGQFAGVMCLVMVAGVFCGWGMCRIGWLRGVRNEMEFRKRVDHDLRVRGELPRGYSETKKKGDKG